MKYSKQEIHNSKRIFKSALMFRAEGLYPLADLILSFIGVALWLWVALLWRDRALIILNAVAMIVLGSGLLRQLTPLLLA